MFDTKSVVLMTDRNLRKSTLDASERRKQREEARQLLKDIKKRCAAYSGVIEETVAQLVEHFPCLFYSNYKYIPKNIKVKICCVRNGSLT